MQIPLVNISIAICGTPVIKQVVAYSAHQSKARRRIFEKLCKDYGSRRESLLIIPSSEISLKIRTFLTMRKVL